MVRYKSGKTSDGRMYDVWLVNKKEMESLGKRWMKDGLFHEVISWPLESAGPDPDGIWRLGDVAVYRKAKNKKFLVEHGVKHLLGEHHK